MLTNPLTHGNCIVNLQGGLCMRGRIYSDQRCHICGANFAHDDRRRGLFCRIIPTNRQPDASGSISAGEPRSGFQTIGKRKGSLTALGGKSIKGPMTPGTTGSTIPWASRLRPANGLR